MIKRILLAGLVALNAFSVQADQTRLGLVLCTNHDNVTQVHTNECGVYNNEKNKWVYYNWVDYIKYKYPDKQENDIVVTRLEIDLSGALTAIIYYTETIPAKVEY